MQHHLVWFQWALPLFWTGLLWHQVVHCENLTVTVITIFKCELSRSSTAICDKTVIPDLIAKPTALTEISALSDPDGKKCFILVQLDFYMTELETFLGATNSQIFSSRCSVDVLDVHYPVEHNRYRVHIDAEIQYKCKPEKWVLDFMDIGSKKSRSYTEILDKKIEEILKEIPYPRFLEDHRVAYFYPANDRTRVAIRLDLEKKRVDLKFTMEVVRNRTRFAFASNKTCEGLSLVAAKVKRETGRWKKPQFTVKLITSMKCGSRSLLKQYTLTKTRETFTKSLLNIGGGNNSVEILVLHDNTNDGWKLLQVDLDTDDVMELRLDAFGGKTLLGEVSSIWNEPGCSLHSLDFQYPVEKNYFRIHVEAKVLQRCHPNKWNKDLLIPTSDLYKSYKEDLEYKIFRVIDEIRLGHYVDSITLAYFFPNSSQTFVVFYLDLNKDSLKQGSLSIKTAAEKLSEALKKPEKCSGRSLLSANVKYETGNWKRPPVTEETPRTDTSLTVTMAAIYNCGQLPECTVDVVGELLLNAFRATKITMNVGLLSMTIPHETDCLILSQQEFYLDELHFHGLSSADAQLFLDVVNSYSQEIKCSADELDFQYPVEKKRYRFHIDAELEENCNPIPWNLELYNLGSNFSRSYRKMVENKIKIALDTLNYRQFTAGYEVAYFYPYQGLLRVVIRLDFEKRLDAKHSLQELTKDITDRLKDPENCQGSLLIPGYTAIEPGIWERPQEAPKKDAKFTVTLTTALHCDPILECKPEVIQKMIHNGIREANSPLKVIRTECLGQDDTSHTTLSRTEFLLGKFDHRLFPWNEKSITSTCTVNLLDIQYPAKINRYRMYIDADLHYQCQPELWGPIFTDVGSISYEIYKEKVENEIKDLLRDIRYLRVLDEFKVAYFYPHDGMTRVAIHLDFIKQQVDQKASKEEVVENIRNRRRRKGNCKGLSIVPVKISTETGFWENPDETPENYAKVTLEGPLLINYERQPWNKDIGHKFSPEYEQARNMVLEQMYRVEKISTLTFRGLSIDRFRRAQGNVSVVVNLFLKKTLLLRTDLARSLLFNILADLDAPNGLDPEATKISGLSLSEVVEKSPKVVQTNVCVISLYGLVSSGDSVNPSSDYANRNTVARLIDQLTEMVENLELQFAPGNKGFWLNNAHELDKWRFKVYFYVTASSVQSLGSVKMAIIKIKSKLGNTAGHGKLRADSTKIDIEQNVKNPLPGQYFTYLDEIYPSGKSLFLEPKRNKKGNEIFETI